MNIANPSLIISQVIPEDIDDLIASFEKSKNNQLKEFSEKGEGFNPETGVIVNNDTSWWDNQIQDLRDIQAQVKKYENPRNTTTF